MTPAVRIQRYADTPSDLPQVGFMYEGNLWQEGEAIDYSATYKPRYSKGLLPVNRSRLRGSVARLLGEGVEDVWVNAEVGTIDLTRTNGWDVQSEMGVLLHLYDIKRDIERAGLGVIGFYGMMWPNHARPELADFADRARHALMGSPRNASIKFTLCEDIREWQRRHGSQVELAYQYCVLNGAGTTAFISPFDDGTPPIWVWTQTCRALRTVCDHYGFDSCMWSDGGVDRAPYAKVDPFVRVYLDTMRS